MTVLDRSRAGQELARRLADRTWRKPVVMAIPPGGVRIAAEIARRLNAPLDVASAVEVLLPGPQMVRLGAVAGGVFIPAARVHAAALDRQYLGRLVELDRTRQLVDESGYRGAQAPIEIARRDVILVDDGWATPIMVEAIVEGLRRRGPASITLVAAECQVETMRRVSHSVATVSLYPARHCREVVYVDERLRQMTHGEAAVLIGLSRKPANQVEVPAMNSMPGASAALQACAIGGANSASHS
jgi:putative phosphoribosyl transferase